MQHTLCWVVVRISAQQLPLAIVPGQLLACAAGTYACTGAKALALRCIIGTSDQGTGAALLARWLGLHVGLHMVALGLVVGLEAADVQFMHLWVVHGRVAGAGAVGVAYAFGYCESGW